MSLFNYVRFIDRCISCVVYKLGTIIDNNFVTDRPLKDVPSHTETNWSSIRTVKENLTKSRGLLLGD